MRVSVLCDDRWHPADIVMQGLKALERDNVDYDFILDAGAWSEEQMTYYPVTILAKSNCRSAVDSSTWLTKEVQRAFLYYVEQGGSLLVVHSGTVGYRNEPVFRGLVGGVFIHHPPSCEVVLQWGGISPVRLNSSPGPVTLFDEHYFVELDDPQANVFMTSESVHGKQPAGWTRLHGKGKVCVITPGHYEEVWANPFYRDILVDALNWCAGTSK